MKTRIHNISAEKLRDWNSQGKGDYKMYTVYEFRTLFTSIYLERTSENHSVYRVIKKERLGISNLFMEMPSASHFAGEECLILKPDYNEDEGYFEYSLFAFNPDALEGTEINPTLQDKSLTLIVRFTLSEDNKAYFSHGEYRIHLEFSDDLRELSLQAYKGVKKSEDPNPEWGRRLKGFVGHH